MRAQTIWVLRCGKMFYFTCNDFFSILLPAQGSVVQESISTADSFEDNEEPSSRSAFRHLPDGLTTELHGSVEYDPSQSFEEAFLDVGD